MKTAVILAAGSSSRMYPFNSVGNKGLLSIAGKTLVERTVSMLVQQGISNIICIISPEDEPSWLDVQQKIQLELGIEITCMPQRAAKGMADALLIAKDHITDDFLVIFPYHYEQEKNVTTLLQQNGPAVLITRTDSPKLYGIVTYDPSTKQLLSITEKPETVSDSVAFKLIGIYRLNLAFLDLLGAYSGEYAFETALDEFAKTANIACIESEGESLSLKYAWHLLDHLKPVLEHATKLDRELGPHIVIDESHGPVVLDEGCKIGQFTALKGPLYIGKNAVIGDHCLIRESSIGAGCVVGAYTEVARSILMENAKIHYSYLADSMIGPGAKIGAGLLTTNKRLDRRTIRVQLQNKTIDSQRTAFGVLIGAQAVLGSRVMTMPGTIIPEKAVILPNQVLPIKSK